MSAAPHDTGVSGFVEVSNDTDRRASVRNVERAHVKPILVTSQLTRASPDRKTEIICPLARSGLAKLRGPSPVRLLARLPENNERAHARSWWRPGRSRSMPSADRPPPRAYGAACRGRCWVLTVMWDGRRRAARLHGREMHANAERPSAVIGFRTVWPSWTSLICLEPLRALRVEAMTRFQRPICVSLLVRCCTVVWASINALLHERLPLPLVQLSPAWSTPARFRASLTVSLLVAGRAATFGRRAIECRRNPSEIRGIEMTSCAQTFRPTFLAISALDGSPASSRCLLG